LCDGRPGRRAANGSVRHLEYEYDDATLIVALFRCTNTSPLALTVAATHRPAGANAHLRGQHGTTSFPVPTGPAA
jgi:hypothetical protein